MKQQKLEPLHDYYGTKVNIGDIVLGAKPGGRFKQTVFIHAIVIGRTAKMLEVHQIDSNAGVYEVTDGLERRGMKGGRLLSEEIIVVEPGYLRETVINKALAKGVRQGPGFPLPNRQHMRGATPTTSRSFGTRNPAHIQPFLLPSQAINP